MKKLMLVTGVAIMLLGSGFGPSAAADEGNWEVKLLPFRFTAVKGDVEKYRLLKWKKDGSVGGIDKLLYELNSKNISAEFETHAIPAENDVSADLYLLKHKTGYFKGEYRTFRKWFDGTGGVYRPYGTSLNVTELDKDLDLDIGHMLVELGTDPEKDTGLSFAYERHLKDGAKSRLAWTSVVEGGTSKKIGPSWQDIDEVHDILTLRGRTPFAGFNLNLEQAWQFLKERSLREEQQVANTGVAADSKLRRQDQELQADVMTSTLRGERWYNEEQSFLGIGYRYNLIRNDELEFLKEFSAAGVPTSFSNPENKFNATAENELDQHIWTMNHLMPLSKDLNFIVKGKAELINTRGNSVYPLDSTNPPDGIPNTTEVSDSRAKVTRFGENISLRYGGLEHTNLYSEFEFEQTRNLLLEQRDSKMGQSAPSTGEVFGRDTLTHIDKMGGTLGARYVPVSWFTGTVQARHKYENNDYDDRKESDASATGAKSAFFDALKIKTDEVETKFTLKPVKRVQTTFRYKFLDTHYFPRIENEVQTKNDVLGNVFSYDVTLQPLDPLLITLAFNRELLKVATPAALASTAKTPGFNSNADSWLLSVSYSPMEKVSLFNTLNYTRARNFDNFSAIGVPLGSDFDQYDTTAGIRWQPRQDLIIEPNYTYSSYQTNSVSAEFGNYSAHVIWLDLTLDF